MDAKILSFVIIMGASVVYVLLERRFPYDKGQKLFREGFFTDFALYGIMQGLILGWVIDQLIRWMDATSGASRLRVVSDWPVWAQLLFFFVAHDLYIYCFHRLQHASKYLWRTHEAHHSGKIIDWQAGTRSHSIEIIINQTIEFAPIVLLGAAPEVAPMKAALDAVWGMYIHSNIDVKSGWLQYVINGPEMHRWHHAPECGIPGKNFSTKLAIWDWIFGTAYLPKDRKPRAYGLGDGVEFPKGYLAQHLYAFRPFEDEDEGGASEIAQGQIKSS